MCDCEKTRETSALFKERFGTADLELVYGCRAPAASANAAAIGRAPLTCADLGQIPSQGESAVKKVEIS